MAVTTGVPSLYPPADSTLRLRAKLYPYALLKGICVESTCHAYGDFS